MTDYQRNGGAVGGGGGGTGLPVATDAGQVPLSDAAGTAYTATDFGMLMGTSLGAVLGSVAGKAVVGRGAGAIAFTSADVSAVLAASNATGMRSALAVYSAAETDAAITTTVGGLLYKAPCLAVATTPVATLSGYPTIDGVTVLAGDANKRVLLTAQATASQNGPWIAASGAWSRPVPNELQACAAFPVEAGTAYHDSVWYLTTNDPITAGVTGIAISQLALNLPASQISDSTAPGRALLTATSAAAQLAALGLGGSSALSSVVLPLTGYAVSTGPTTVAAWVAFDPALYAAIGKTTVITLETTGSVSAGGLTGTATLQNLTDAASVATISVLATTPTAQTASVALPATAKVYELRLSLSGSGYVASGAQLRITWI